MENKTKIIVVLLIIILTGAIVFAYQGINKKINQMKDDYYNYGFNEARKSILYDFRYKLINEEDIIVSIPDRDWLCDDIDANGQWSLAECFPANNTQFIPVKFIPTKE